MSHQAIYPATFAGIREAQLSRCARWHEDETEPWTGADWSNAFMGEVGEVAEVIEVLMIQNSITQHAGKAADIVKKLRREETGVPGRGEPKREGLVNELRKELADVFLYMDLLAAHYDIDLLDSIGAKFNAVSREFEFPEMIGLPLIDEPS